MSMSASYLSMSDEAIFLARSRLRSRSPELGIWIVEQEEITLSPYFFASASLIDDCAVFFGSLAKGRTMTVKRFLAVLDRKTSAKEQDASVKTGLSCSL